MSGRASGYKFTMPLAGETPKNGNYVTWRELNLSLSPIHEKLDDIADKMNIVLDERIQHRTRYEGKTSRKATVRFWAMIISTLLSGAIVTLAVAIGKVHL